MRYCTFSGNSASDSAAFSGFGGAIYVSGLNLHDGGGSTATVENCTFSGNTATFGSSIYNHGTFDITGCTFTHATGGQAAHGGIYNLGGSRDDLGRLTLRNTILHAGPGLVNLINVGGTLTSLGYNLSSDSGSGFLNGPGDQVNIDPRLDYLGLGNHGGATPTIALLSGSPALDRGNSFGLTADQRGQTRPVDLPDIDNASGGDGSDIGAFEASDPIQAGTAFVVTTSDDHDDGACGTSDCTLREAINRANAVAGANVINLAFSGTITLSALGELNVSASTIINGPGARLLAISGNQVRRVFNFTDGTSTISGLTIRDGHSLEASGKGGGILNEAALTVTDCAFLGHQATGRPGSQPGQIGGSASGSAVFNDGTLTLDRCSFSGNTARGGKGANITTQFGRPGNGGSADGGAVFNNSTATLTIMNCTFSDNSGFGGAGGDNTNFGGGSGGNGNGGVFNQGTMTMTACTLGGNTGTGGAGGLGNSQINNGAKGAGRGGLTADGGASTVRNTITAGNTGNAGPDASGTFDSTGYNFVGKSNGSTGFTATGDQTGTIAVPLDAQLGSFQNNGGPTDTIALLPGSPALDQGKGFVLTTDQRMQPRPIDVLAIANAIDGDGSDIGAVEMDPPQSGSTFIVTVTADHDDGVCSSGDCTLREAIITAKAALGANPITFGANVAGTIFLQSLLGTLQITEGVVIHGPGPRTLAVSGNGVVRVFQFSGGSHFLSGLTIRDGGSGRASGEGGGILNEGTLTVTDCAFLGHQVTGFAGTQPGQSGGSASGGAVFNDGTLTLNRCSFSGNTARGGKGANITTQFGRPGNGGSADGGAVFNNTAATLTIMNCTFSNNSGLGGAGGDNPNFGGGSGGNGNGGVFNQGTMTMTACTLGGNTGTGGAGGLGNSQINDGAKGAGRGGLTAEGGTSAVSNTLCAGNTGNAGADMNGSFTSEGYNLIGNGDFSNGFTATGDQVGTTAAPIDAKLGPLQNNGGATDTMALLNPSPALDQGKNFGVTTDQRGLPRPIDVIFANAAAGDGSDIGAVEMNLLGGADSDGDGMSDDFETFFGVSDPSADADSDGLTTLQEFKAGTNPLDVTSGLRITMVARNGNDFVFTFSIALTGKSYRLERKDALTEATWRSISGVLDLTPTSTGSAQITDTGVASGSHHFYHVRVLP